jgi:hypothetical protein
MVVLLRHLANDEPANAGVVISHAVAPSRPTQRAMAGRTFFMEVVSFEGRSWIKPGKSG